MKHDLTKLEREAKENYERAVQRLDEQDSRIQALPDFADADPTEVEFQMALFDKLKEDADRAKSTWERQIALAKARRSIRPLSESEGGDGDDEDNGDEIAAPSPGVRRAARMSVREPLVYEPRSGNSYFRDLVKAELEKDAEALTRLELHGRQVIAETRDVTTGDPGAAAFIPPLYLGGQWIDTTTPGRPFADAIVANGGGVPLSPVGKTMDFPRVTVAPDVAVQEDEGDAVNETDFDSDTYSVSKVTIAGQNDTSIQTLEFSDPSIDTIIMRELQKSYNQKLDYQLLYGTGTKMHRGIKVVVVSDGGNNITFSSGGADDLLAKIYEAQSDISTNAPGYDASHVLIHSRRAAWMASHRDGNGNLFQQGQLFLAAGEQDAGFVGNIAGLRVIRDANIQTAQGASSKEDDVFVLNMTELMLAEGPVRTRVLQEVLSGTLQVRIQLYAFSAFAGGRRPATMARISGAGLTTPTFPSA